MDWSFLFFLNSVLFGIGLAMDAFSVSLANGLNEPHMKAKKMCDIAGTFAFFQALMPMVGWFCIHTVVQYFESFEKWIPWIALILLAYIGGKMLVEGLRHKNGEEEASIKLGVWSLIVQGVATSIDALSVGFTIAELPFPGAFTESIIIAAVTFGICMGGLFIGKKFSTVLAGKSSILGGAILIAIGLEIFISGMIG